MKILMIAYEFPPLNVGGSHRPARFANNLKAFGIEPIVLTLNTTDYPQNKIDAKLMEQQPNFDVVRTALGPPVRFEGLKNSYYINIVGTEAKRWKSSLNEAVDKLVKEHKIEAIYITAPPFSIVKLGLDIAQKHKLPSIVDLRDAWSQWCITPYASVLHYNALKKLERNCLKRASAVVATSDQTLHDFQQLNPELNKEKFHLVTNAYTADLGEIPETLAIEKTTGKFIIGYVGSFYYTPYQRKLMLSTWWKKKPHQFLQYSPRQEDWLYRSPYFFFKALAAFKEKYPSLAQRIELQLVGKKPEWMDAMVEEFGVSAMVKHLGVMQHKDAIAFQKDCDALLITSSKVIDGQDYSIAGKTYEYIAQLKPILAFVAAGAQKRILQRTGLSILCDADDTAASVEQLKSLLSGATQLNLVPDFIKSLHIRATTQKLADLINSLTTYEQ